MEGYVTPQPDSRYVEVLQKLQEKFIAVWPSKQIRFYQFGSSIRPANAGYKDASNPCFYRNCDRRTKDSFHNFTDISLVFRQAAPDALTLVVTDLFQSDADVGAMVRALAQALQNSKPKLVVAILALRSEFDGKVYDVGPHAFTFDYKSNARDAHTFRPFYVVLVGHEPVVTRYIQVLRSIPSVLSTTDHVLLLSRQPFADLLTLKRNRLTFQSASGARPQSAFYRCPSDLVAGFELTNRNQSATLKARAWGLEVLDPDGLAILPGKLSSIVSVKETRDANTWQDSDELSTVLQPRLELQHSHPLPVATITPTSNLAPDGIDSPGLDEKAEFYLTLTIDSARLEPSVYLYAFRILWTADLDAFQLPNWCQEWDMDLAQLPKWVSHPATFDGSKTLNLKSFISDLWATMIEDSPLSVGQLYLYLNPS